VATHSSWQALPPLKTVPVQNAQFNNIGVIKNGDIFHYQNSDAVNAFGVIERFGNGIVMFDKRYFTTANFVKITVQPKPAPKPKTSSTIKNPPSVPGGFLSKLWNSIVLSFYLLFSRLFAVISWVVTKAVTAVAKALELVAKAVWDGVKKATKAGMGVYIVFLLLFFLFFPSTFLALTRFVSDSLAKLIGRKSPNK
jgi:hypothetical protein